jgi:hypothetical protein
MNEDREQVVEVKECMYEKTQQELDVLAEELESKMKDLKTEEGEEEVEVRLKLIQLELGLNSNIIMGVGILFDNGPVEYSLTADVSNCNVENLHSFVEALKEFIVKDMISQYKIGWIEVLEKTIPGQGMYASNRIGFTVLAQ